MKSGEITRARANALIAARGKSIIPIYYHIRARGRVFGILRTRIILSNIKFQVAYLPRINNVNLKRAHRQRM